MERQSHQIKHIVAALALAVGFSGPVAADQARVDDLLGQLQSAEPGQADRIAREIGTEWSKSGSAAIDLLLRRGQDALDAGDPALAAEHFTAAIDHAPDFAEAYNGRANAYYLEGYIGPALDDLRQTLVLNPQNFIAMRGFGVLLEELGRDEAALEVFHRVLDLYPTEESTLAAVERLELRLGGRSL
jgi:tetratricopeptide (TPR) repeat protein